MQKIVGEQKLGAGLTKDIEMRFLSPNDIDEVRLLCEESFPIEYPLSWYVSCAIVSTSSFTDFLDLMHFRYEDITTNSTRFYKSTTDRILWSLSFMFYRFYSLAAVYNCAIVGLLVAEIKSWAKLNKEDRTILSESLGRNSSLAYILSLGVHRK